MLNLLRLREGFALRDFQVRTGLPASQIAPALAKAVERGWLHVSQTHVTPTALGLRFANDVMELFLDA
jgi:oxygen-independent coproporphyrinogen-3 oxidase